VGQNLTFELVLSSLVRAAGINKDNNLWNNLLAITVVLV